MRRVDCRRRRTFLLRLGRHKQASLGSLHLPGTAEIVFILFNAEACKLRSRSLMLADSCYRLLQMSEYEVQTDK